MRIQFKRKGSATGMKEKKLSLTRTQRVNNDANSSITKKKSLMRIHRINNDANSSKTQGTDANSKSK